MSPAPDDALLRGAVWLDLTRLLTRAGRGAPTGIDRVELAWFDHLSAANSWLMCLCRTTRGFLLLPPGVARAIVDVVRGTTGLGRADLWSRATGRGARPRHRAEAMVRHGAADRCPPWGLAGMIRRHGPDAYLNVGHANLRDRVLGAFQDAGTDVVVLVHDLIPVLHPDLVPPDQPGVFAARIDAVARHASLVATVSGDTRASLERHWSSRDRSPPVVAVPIGIPAIPPAGPPEREAGRFLMIGTLEPRKNHATLLKAWSLLAGEFPKWDMPQLHILGNEGWQGDAIRREIEGHDLFGTAIFLGGGVHDDALAEQMRRADALLYPSLAEGFGLPPWEALDAGLLPICSDLPVLRELLGARAVYVDPTDVYSWAETVRQRARGGLEMPVGAMPDRPRWQEHFAGVARALAEVRQAGRLTGQKGRE
ncbi:glycosyltransferase [Roseibacterium sp. SDUM158017]|uniref:glycosyltransferase n=1 Tax=Roseicyclus salinarum TaxID=3036773 RepID=UPI0024159142|nr:glycosyltransferase [Roseibacterium sp. SDUM158017]MDG4646981.1 glycosyltransferase [Roseibacterium sp. SDUM158017]